MTDIVRMADDSAYRDAAINEMRSLGMNDHEVWATIWMDGAKGGDDGFAAAARIRAGEPSFAAAFKEADHASRGGLFSNPKVMDKVLEAHPQIKVWYESGDSRLRAFARSEIEKMQGQHMEKVGGPGLSDPDNFVNWLQHGKGWESLLAGRADQGVSPIRIVPRVTRASQAWLDVKMPLEQRIGKWMETGGWKAHGEDVDAWTRVGNEVKFLGGKFFNDLTQHIPTHDFIDINGPQAGVQLQRFMARALPYARRWEIYGEFMGQATPAGRRLVAQRAVS